MLSYQFDRVSRVRSVFVKKRQWCYIFTGVPANSTQTKISYGRISLRRLGAGSSRKESRFVAAGRRVGRTEAGNVAIEDRTRRSES